MRINKRNNKEFVEGVCARLLKIGAKKVNDATHCFRTFELQTVVGILLINVPTDNSYCYTIFSKFVDVELAKQKYACNPYSGKFNVHVGATSGMSIQQYIESALSPFKSLKNHE